MCKCICTFAFGVHFDWISLVQRYVWRGVGGHGGAGSVRALFVHVLHHLMGVGGIVGENCGGLCRCTRTTGMHLTAGGAVPFGGKVMSRAVPLRGNGWRFIHVESDFFWVLCRWGTMGWGDQTYLWGFLHLFDVSEMQDFRRPCSFHVSTK